MIYCHTCFISREPTSIVGKDSNCDLDKVVCDPILYEKCIRIALTILNKDLRVGLMFFIFVGWLQTSKLECTMLKRIVRAS